MANYADMAVGDEREVPVGGGTAKVTRAEHLAFTVQRHLDGSWNTVVWVRADNNGWGVSREEGSVGAFFDDLDSAFEDAISRRDEALH